MFKPEKGAVLCSLDLLSLHLDVEFQHSFTSITLDARRRECYGRSVMKYCTIFN